MHRLGGCVLAAAAVLAATVLPWSSTAAADRNGWGTASLALALDEAVHRPALTLLACVWFVVPLSAATALVVSVRLPRRSAVLALRALGALLVVVVLTVLVALWRTSLDVAPFGPLLTLAGGAALVALPAGSRSWSGRRRDGAAATGAQP